MLEIPAMPPNCLRFCRQIGEDYFRISTGGWVRIVDLSTLEREDCAAVAEVAWLKEERRLSEQPKAQRPVRYGPPVCEKCHRMHKHGVPCEEHERGVQRAWAKRRKAADAIRGAAENARAWREWGEASATETEENN